MFEYGLTLIPSGKVNDAGHDIWKVSGTLAGFKFSTEGTLSNRGTGLWRSVPHESMVLGGTDHEATMALADAIEDALDAAARQIAELGHVRIPRVDQ